MPSRAGVQAGSVACSGGRRSLRRPRMTFPRHAEVQAEAERIESLDGVRGVAILLVILMHAMFFGVPLPGTAPLDAGALWPSVAALGWCGVDLFFVLSGFLITGILLRARGSPHYFRNFYVRRALRIFPLYYAVLALLLFGLERAPATTAEKLSYFLYYQNVRYALFGEVASDPARLITWSLAIEEQFYLIWPAVVAAASRQALQRICVALIGGAIVLRFLLLAAGLHTTYFLTPCRLDTLAAGALLALVPAPPMWLGRLALAAGAAGLIAVARIAGTSLPEAPHMQRYGLIAALCFAVGVVVLARGEGWSARALRWRPLRSLGRYSYCVYLVHFLVVDHLAHYAYYGMHPNLQRWLATHVPPTGLVWLFTAACLLLSWGLAFASWHLFEKWFLALKRYFPSGGDPTR